MAPFDKQKNLTPFLQFGLIKITIECLFCVLSKIKTNIEFVSGILTGPVLGRVP